MQTTITIPNISNLTIAIYDDKSSEAFIKKQKSRSREAQKKTYRKLKSAKQSDGSSFYKRSKTRVRSVEMYDEDVYADDDYADDGLERIDWETLVYNTASFHRTFMAPDQDEFLELYADKYPGDCEEDEFDRMNEELLTSARESPYHQEMLDLYAGIVANIAPPVVKTQYSCCVGCRSSNGCRPFYSCERYDEVFGEDDENDGEELLDLYNQMLDDMERGDA